MITRKPVKPRENCIAGNPTGEEKCCLKENSKHETPCAITPKEQEAFQRRQQRRNQRRKKKKKTPYDVRAMTWKDKHCKGVMFFVDRPKDMKSKLEKLQNELQDIEDDFDDLVRKIGENAAAHKVEHVKEIGLCAGAGAVIGAIVGAIFGEGVGAWPGAEAGMSIGADLCGAAAGAQTAIDALQNTEVLMQRKEQFEKSMKQLQDNVNKVHRLQEMLNEPDKKRQEMLKRQLQKEVEDAVKNDKCLQARRCLVVPYSQTKNKHSAKGLSPLDQAFGLGNPHGCCPGQTGHHLVYEKMVKHCPGYDGNKAPVVCVEGTTQHKITHKQIHDHTDTNTKHMVNGRYEKHSGIAGCDEHFTMACAIESGAQAHAALFPDAGCNKTCIKQQLRAFYSKLECDPLPVDKNGKVIEKDRSNTDREGL